MSLYLGQCWIYAASNCIMLGSEGGEKVIIGSIVYLVICTTESGAVSVHL